MTPPPDNPPASQPWYHWQGKDLILQVIIQPRASRDEIVGPHGDQLKVRIKAPPVDGKANQHLTAFLSKTFRVSKSCVCIEKGQSGRVKRIRILSPELLPPCIT